MEGSSYGGAVHLLFVLVADIDDGVREFEGEAHLALLPVAVHGGPLFSVNVARADGEPVLGDEQPAHIL